MMNVRKLFRWIWPKQKPKADSYVIDTTDSVEILERIKEVAVSYPIESTPSDRSRLGQITIPRENEVTLMDQLDDTERRVIEMKPLEAYEIANSNRRAREQIRRYQEGGSDSSGYSYPTRQSSGGSDILVSAIPVAIAMSIDSSPSCSSSDSSSSSCD